MLLGSKTGPIGSKHPTAFTTRSGIHTALGVPLADEHTHGWLTGNREQCCLAPKPVRLAASILLKSPQARGSTLLSECLWPTNIHMVGSLATENNAARLQNRSDWQQASYCLHHALRDPHCSRSASGRRTYTWLAHWQPRTMLLGSKTGPIASKHPA